VARRKIPLPVTSLSKLPEDFSDLLIELCEAEAEFLLD
jgi:hypothetical protein